jgi:hypothetical protein
LARNRRTQVKLAEAPSSLREIAELRDNNAALQNGLEYLQESLRDALLRMEDIGWKPLGEDYNGTEYPLEAAKRNSVTTRALVTINPLVKRGMNVRTAYIWGAGVEFKGIENYSEFAEFPANKKWLMSPKAHAEMEMCLGTDGNFILLLTKLPKPRVQRIPLHQITGTINNPDNFEEIWFYRREWDSVRSSQTDERTDVTEHNTVYYPATDYDAEVYGRPRRWRGKPVDWSSAIAVSNPNKQSGWRWGVPDVLSVMSWAKAHKEFLETQASLVKSYARYAFKVTAPATSTVRAAAAKVGTSPTLDPHTGEPNHVGATFLASQGATISAMGRTGGSVDFKAGIPLAGYVAAGLNVPLNELTADAGEANRASAETLTTVNEKIFQDRQAEHTAFFEQVFTYFGMDVETVFPPITEEAVYRQIQAIVQAAALNVFSAEEVRDMLIHAFDLDLDSGVPSEEQLGNLILQMTKQAEQAEKDAELKAKAAAEQPDNYNPSNGDNSYRADATRAGRSGAKV